MSTRAVTSIAYLVYTDTQKNMIATKIQIVSNRIQNITTMIQITDCTDYENAQLKLYKMPIKVYRLTECPACHVMFESSFHASILLSHCLCVNLFHKGVIMWTI